MTLHVGGGGGRRNGRERVVRELAFIVPPVPYYSTLLYTGPLGLYKGLQWLLGSGKLWNSRSSPSCADTETDNNNHARTCGLDGSLIKVKRGIKCGRKNGERIAAVRVPLRPGSCFRTSSCDCGSSAHRTSVVVLLYTIYHLPPTHPSAWLNARSCSAWRRQPVVIHHARCSSRRREASRVPHGGPRCRLRSSSS